MRNQTMRMAHNSLFSKRRKLLFFLLLTTVFLSATCTQPPENTPTPYKLEIPQFFPTQLNIPYDNPLTVEGVELGRHLFYDEHLCGYIGTEPDSLMSCATCHVQEHAFKAGIDNIRFPGGKVFGRSGNYTHHNMLPLINLVFNNEGYLWSGAVHSQNPNPQMRNIEDIVRMTILDPNEMNSSIERTLEAIRTNPKYPEMFQKAFGSDEITIERIEKAIAQFVRTLISANSKFDRYLRGQEQLTPQELNGYILFSTEEGADCFHCHGGSGTPLFTTNLFYNNALNETHTDPQDHASVTGNTNDIGTYRAPTLRNIAVTAPYMHDGRFSSLDQVLNFYNSELVTSPTVSPLMHKINEGGANLTPSQIADLKAFLNTLTDEEFLSNPKFSNPNP